MSRYKELYSNKIKDLIIAKRMTQKEVASLIPISERQLGQNLLKGDMKISTLKRISEILKVKIVYFFTESKPNQENLKNYNIDNKVSIVNENNPNTNNNMRRLVDCQDKVIILQEEKIELLNEIQTLKDKLNAFELGNDYSKDVG